MLDQKLHIREGVVYIPVCDDGYCHCKEDGNMCALGDPRTTRGCQAEHLEHEGYGVIYDIPVKQKPWVASIIALTCIAGVVLLWLVSL